MYWYWWAWWVFVVFLIFMPLSYGWGYRRWGPPYPRYYARRRAARGRAMASVAPPPTGAVTTEDRVDTHPGWGIAGDLLWLAVLGAVIWAIVALWA